MKATRAEIERILAALDETPRWLTRSTSRVDAKRLRLKPDPASWSAVDILSHLRACSDVWGASIDSMLSEDEPALPEIHPRQWQKQADYDTLSFGESLKIFARQRRGLLKMLTALAFEDWERGAMLGGRRHTVFTQARRLAKHEAEHCKQIEEMLIT